MNTCAECRHYMGAQICEAVGARDAAIIVVGPSAGATGIQALYARYNEMLCGLEGKWWEQK